ncbi:hypothetical protein DFH29DRAFT_1010233 [Suillus ampliporus]|nr:hypothetical protein DFH29DRAFT_1010233 [Suillus ampliporus]
MSSHKGKGKGKRKSQAQAADFNNQFGLDLDFNASSSVDPSFGVVVPYMQPYRDSTTAPNPRFTQAALNSNLAASNSFNPPNPYFTSPHPYFPFPTPNPNFTPSNTSDFPPPNFAPLNASDFPPPNANFSAHNPDFTLLNPGYALPNSDSLPNLSFAGPNIVAPHPRLPPNTTDLELMVESYRAPPFWRHRTTEAHASAHSQPYNRTVHRRPSPIPQAQQVGFEPEAVRGTSRTSGVRRLQVNANVRRSSRSVAGPSTAPRPSTAAGPSTLPDDDSDSDSKIPLNAATPKKM